jgi:alpha-tubulin suppressor-like RCC1 family protein
MNTRHSSFFMCVLGALSFACGSSDEASSAPGSSSGAPHGSSSTDGGAGADAGIGTEGGTPNCTKDADCPNGYTCELVHTNEFNYGICVAHAVDTPPPRIAATVERTCALTSQNDVKCWGWNYYGELGNGTSGNNDPAPGDVLGLNGPVQQVSTGGHITCALTKSGGVKCWGYNHIGEVGNGAILDGAVPTPNDVVGLTSDVKEIAAGDLHGCALMASGKVQCWGNACFIGDTQVYPPHEVPPKDSPVPLEVTGLVDVKNIAAGSNHTCAITKSGGLKCWGWNLEGELGNGNQDTYTGVCHATEAPTDVVGLGSDVVQVAAGSRQTCALTGKGGVKCWGANANYELGTSSVSLDTGSLVPVDVDGLSSGVVAIAVGGAHACALLSSGGAMCWGRNTEGQLGVDTPPYEFNDRRSLPVKVEGLPGPLVGIAAGHQHTCGLLQSGGVVCWGSNVNGELGNGTVSTAPQFKPTSVIGF